MRRRFDEMNCSIAQALEVLGDWWTLLIIREAFLGTRRFADFEANLGISKSVLARRLRQLIDHEVLEAIDAGQFGRRLEYRLTARGKDLITVITALRQWGDRWIHGEGREPLLVLDRRTGRPLPRLRIVDEAGAPVAAGDMVVAPGPGADQETKDRFARARLRSG